MNILSVAILSTAFLLIITGMYLLTKTNNMIRIIIAVELAMKAITTLLLFAGYVNGNFAMAQAFIITVIVIEVIVAVVAAGIAINIFRHNGDMNIKKLNRLNG